MSTATQPMTFQAWLDHYQQHIRPLRDPADAGDATYVPYDDAYNEHLEQLHQMIQGKVRLLDNASELMEAAAAYLASLPDFSDFELDPEEKATWDAAWQRLYDVLGVVAARELCPNHDAGVASCDCNDCQRARAAAFETWLRTFSQEYLRRTQITWEDGGGDEETARQYYENGRTPSQAVTEEIQWYGLADTGAGT